MVSFEIMIRTDQSHSLDMVVSHERRLMSAWYYHTTAAVVLVSAYTVFTTECDNLQHPPIGAESYQILSIYDSFSSQTWAIFVPNRNFDLKSIQSSTKSPSVRYQNWGCLQNLFKIQEKITFSHKILMKS